MKAASSMKILVTGSAGFIGSHLTMALLKRGAIVIGIDNHNDYYDPKIKEDRLKLFGDHENYTHYRVDLADFDSINKIFQNHQPQRVVNLAAQAGVGYSLKNPRAYIESNITGFTNILECCREFAVSHLVYASSSSVYGGNTNMPFSEANNTNHPLSLYSATKKSNELLAHSYSHLFNIPTTGLRFFTVYGPWGRPDMALFKFTKSIISGEPIKVYNHGKHRRDFTYIDDIIEGVIRILEVPATPNPNWDSNTPDPATSNAPWRIYNIGGNNPINLMEYINALEQALGKTAIKEFFPLQPGDIPDTFANVDYLINEFNYKPNTGINFGVQKFVDWYLNYFHNSQPSKGNRG